MKRLSLLLLLALMGLGLPIGGQAQGPATPTFAAIIDGQVAVYPKGGAAFVLNLPPPRLPVLMGYRQLAWSPNAQYLAIVQESRTEDFSSQYTSLLIADMASLQVFELVPNIYADLPVTFAEVGGQIAAVYALSRGTYSQNSEFPSAEDIAVYAQVPQVGSTPSEIVELDYGLGCGGGSPFPGDWVYTAEAGFGGARGVLVASRIGLIYSHHCSNYGIQVVNLETGEERELGDNLGDMVFSPDGNLAAAVQFQYDEATNQVRHPLMVMNLLTGAMVQVPTTGEADQLVWVSPSQLVYSTYTPGTSLYPLPPDRAQQLADLGYRQVAALGGFPLDSVALYLYNAGDGSNILLYTAPAYRIGRLQTGQSLLFSQIPNAEAWLGALLAGADPYSETAARDYFPLAIFEMSLSDFSTTQIGTGWQLLSTYPY
jgi:hypothetical protein